MLGRFSGLKSLLLFALGERSKEWASAVLNSAEIVLNNVLSREKLALLLQLLLYKNLLCEET